MKSSQLSRAFRSAAVSARRASGRAAAMVAAWLGLSLCGFADDFFDRIDRALTVGTADGRHRLRLSGMVEAEAYAFDGPAPALLYADDDFLFNPRLTLFLDAQMGPRVYGFAQARWDRGFDPSEKGGELRLDEYAVRVAVAADDRLHVQLGKFATIVGNWMTRHDSWTNPLVTAPLLYEHPTGLWDSAPAESGDTVLRWAHVRPAPFVGDENADKILRLPAVWGPVYAQGAAVAGRLGKFEYAAEVKNAALSSRPESWNHDRGQWRHPALAARVGYRPDLRWSFGASASEGSYLMSSARRAVRPGRAFGDYRQIVFAQDIGYAWRRWQVWAEFYEVRFKVPSVGDLDVFAYYVEAKHKLTARTFAAARWNEERFGRVRESNGARTRWGHDVRRLDAAGGFRFSAHAQLKLQYSLKHERRERDAFSHLLAAQFVQRF